MTNKLGGAEGKMTTMLGRTLFGYCWIMRDANGEVSAIAYAPPEAVQHLTENEKRKLPLVTPMGNIVESEVEE